MLVTLAVLALTRGPVGPAGAQVWRVAPTDPPSLAVRILPPGTDAAGGDCLLAVAPAAEQRVRAEPIAIGDEAPSGWARGTRLPGASPPRCS